MYKRFYKSLTNIFYEVKCKVTAKKASAALVHKAKLAFAKIKAKYNIKMGSIWPTVIFQTGFLM